METQRRIDYLKTACILVLVSAFLLLPADVATSTPPKQEPVNIYLPLVSVASIDPYSQLLNNIGGTENLFQIVDNLAFLGSGARLDILDLSDPASPQFLKDVLLPASPTFMATQNGYAYITLGRGGIAIVDYRQASNASVSAHLPIEGYCFHVSVSGDLAFISNEEGLYVIDISQPGHPRILSHVPMLAYSTQMYQSLLVVAGAGFIFLDISNPENPVKVGSFETGTLLAINSHYAYVNDSGCGITGCDYFIDTVDINDPSQPQWLSLFHVSSDGASSMEFNSDLAFIVAGAGIIVARVSSEGALEPISGYSGDVIISALYADNRLYVGTMTSIDILDVSDPEQIKQIGAYASPEHTFTAVQAIPAFVYCRTKYSVDNKDTRSLQVVDFSHPEEPQISSETIIETGYRADQVYLDGRYAYLTADTGRYAGFFPIMDLRIFDLEQPAAPVQVSEYLPGTGGYGQGLWFEGLRESVEIKDSIGYLITLDKVLEIVDFSDPATPVVLSHVPASARRVQVDGNHAYLGVEEYIEPITSLKLMTLDVSNPRDPTIQSSFVVITPAFPGYPYSFDVSNGIAYFGLPGELRMLNVHDPVNPTYLTSFPLTSQLAPTSIEAEGDLVLLGVEGRLEVIDVGDPLNPSQLSTFDTAGYITSIQVLGRYAYVACGDTGAQIIDINAPDRPSLAQRYPGYTTSVQTQSYYPLYVVNLNDGLLVYKPYPPVFPR